MEREVTSTELRVYLRGLANSVAQTQERITIKRHGLAIAVLVSLEDLEFLRKHKPHPTPQPVPEPMPCEQDQLAQLLRDPEKMEQKDVEDLLDATMHATSWDVREWRARAMRVRLAQRMQASTTPEMANPTARPSTGPPC